MQKTFLLLCFTAWLTTFASAQTSHIEASWTAEKNSCFQSATGNRQNGCTRPPFLSAASLF